MNAVVVHYHRENDAWWAESDSMPGFSALSPSFEDLRRTVHGHLAEEGYANIAPIEYVDGFRIWTDSASRPTSAALWWSVSESAGFALAEGRARYGKSTAASELVRS